MTPSLPAACGWVAAGGAVGALARFGAGALAARWLGDQFPWGTLVVNLVGCLAIGAVWHAVHAAVLPEAARHALAVGLLGGLTTFSSFGYETVTLLEREAFGLAVANVLGNLGLGLGATGAGLALARWWWPVV